MRPQRTIGLNFFKIGADLKNFSGLGGMVRGWLLPLVTVAVWAMVTGGVQANSDDDAPPDALKQYVKLVEELGIQRRVNVLYPNPQSLFDGLPVGFVNTTTGNLTFRRRDIVTMSDGGPVIFARVYDSRITDNVDLGPGWRLSLAEKISPEAGGSYLYLDGSGTRHRFVDGEAGYVVSPPTPRHNRTQLSMVNEKIVLHEADGTVRTFGLFSGSDSYQIVSLSTAQNRLEFLYEDGLLARIDSDGEMLFELSRGTHEERKIVAVTDRHGRSVRYKYTDGRLQDVHDLVDNIWEHKYNSMGLLTVAMDANGQPYLEASFDESGRVTRSHTARERVFTYWGSTTRVVEKDGDEYTFRRYTNGATAGLESSTGVMWQIKFDDSNRVRVLARPDSTLTYTFNASGNVSTLTEATADSKLIQELTYDDVGRLTNLRVAEAGSADEQLTDILYERGNVRVSGPGIAFAYEVSANDLIEWVRKDDETIVTEYNPNGDLTRLGSEERSVSFERNALGRIVATSYPNDLTIRYTYDDLGNRELVEYGPGGTAEYEHDAVGNIVSILLDNESGETQVQSLDIGAMNRVERIEYEGWLGVDVKYDEMDRPIAFRKLTDDVTLPTPAEFVEIAYTETGRIAKIESQTTGESWVPEDGWPIDEANIVNDPRAEILGRKLRGKAHPDYGVVEFVETTFDAIPVAPLELGVPSLRKATSLQSLASGLLSPRQVNAIIQFEKASNPVFQPPEYRSTNCCVPCLGSGCECWLIRWDFENFCGCADLLDYFTKITEFLLRQEEEQEQEEEEEEEEERRCRPCSPPVGTKMYQFHLEHVRVPGFPGLNHGVQGHFHYHHYEIHQRPTDAPSPCLCWDKLLQKATDSMYDGEILHRKPTGGGLE